MYRKYAVKTLSRRIKKKRKKKKKEIWKTKRVYQIILI